MQNIFHLISLKVAIGLVALGSLFTPVQTVDNNLGSEIPVVTAGFETILQASISTTDTTMTLANLTNKAGNAITGYKCFTISEGSTNQEFICGTATTSNRIINMVRGIDPEDPGTSSSTLAFTHRRGENVKETDYPILGILARQNNGVDGFPNVLKYDSAPTHTYGQNQLTTWDKAKDYVDGIAIAGSPIMSTSLAGIAKLSTTAASTTNPIVVGDNDTRIPTQDENDALAGVSPSATSTYVTLQALINGITSTTTISGPFVVSSSTASTTYGFGFAHQRVITTTGTSTWSKPTGVNWIKVKVQGGGGAGGNGGSNSATCGGAGGGYSEGIIDVSSTSSVLVTVGTASATSSFGSFVIASGGILTVQGIGTGGSINTTGGPASCGAVPNGNYFISGDGGSSMMGEGGNRVITGTGSASNGGNATGYGGGGGGCSAGTSLSCSGGSGSQGIVIIEY